MKKAIVALISLAAICLAGTSSAATDSETSAAACVNHPDMTLADYLARAYDRETYGGNTTKDLPRGDYRFFVPKDLVIENRPAGYESLTLTGYGPFKDGSIVGVVNEAQAIAYRSWVIRFKPDLTSPFFAGRTDIVPVDQKTVFDTIFFTYKMDFENHNYDPPDSALEKVITDMRAVLVEATRRQAAERP